VIIFAIRAWKVERGSGDASRKIILFLRFCLSVALPYQDRSRVFSLEKRNENEFSFAKGRSIYRVVASRCVAAIKP